MLPRTAIKLTLGEVHLQLWSWNQNTSPYTFAVSLGFVCYEHKYSLIDTIVTAEDFRQGKEPAVLDTAQVF